MKVESVGSARLRPLFAAAMLSCGLYLLGMAHAWRHTTVTFRQTTTEIPTSGIALFAGGLLLVGAGFSRRLPSAALLAATALAVATTLALALFAQPQQASSPPAHVEIKMSAQNPHEPPVQYYDVQIGENHFQRASTYAHPQLGVVYSPGTLVHESHQPDYDAHYLIGADGWRVVPDIRPRLALLGCSFTFGVGVSDDETFAARLGRALSPETRVQIAAASGWGTAHAAVVCDRLLAEPNPPRRIVYAWLHHHLQRNWRRQSWHRFMNALGEFPHFEVANGQLQYQGMLKHGEGQSPDNDETTAREVAITQALLRSMHDKCRAKNCRFAMVAIPETSKHPNDPICSWIANTDIPFVDLREASRDFFPHDGHPTAAWHAAVSDGILNSHLLDDAQPPATSGN